MALMVYLLPQESQGMRNRKLKKYSVLLSLVIVSLSIVIIPILIQTIFPMYEESIIPIQIMSIGIIPITISVIFESFFLGREQTQLVLIAISLQTGLYFLLIITLGNQLGLIGIAISFLISTIVRSIFSASISRIRFKSWA
jgi:O-antigen/teichoic acid export membrane protein